MVVILVHISPNIKYFFILKFGFVVSLAEDKSCVIVTVAMHVLDKFHTSAKPGHFNHLAIHSG